MKIFKMESSSRNLCNQQKIFMVAVIALQIAILSGAEDNETTVLPQMESVREKEVPSLSEYIWSSWGNWSACSKTCGGGVAVQERHCIQRLKITSSNDIWQQTISETVTTQAHSGREKCDGVDRRYHECNTLPCSGDGTMKNSREQQCSAYNRRPFRGQFYTWIPYIDGNAPCILNCRPLGQQFYASLTLVADGTPCTKPGFRAICVQGDCKVVGRDAVLAVTGTREARCGRRLVSGLFSRPRLPLGYTYVTTVPRGACRLNVSEIIPSENYIALKITNSSYIVNGEFAVSAPGMYDAAGTRFLYTRKNGLDSIFALGPIQYPIDIMILYTQPNPSIKYAYFTESQSGEIDTDSVTGSSFADSMPTVATKHSRRHHTLEPYPRSNTVFRYPDFDSISKESFSNEEEFEENIVGTRKFIWKIASYTECSRSCGGGIQVGKYRCVEASANGVEREVSQVHCAGSTPAPKRHRCGIAPCPPRWRAAAWSSCPQCGPASRTRIVGCVQDHFRGIIKISDQKCPTPKPETSETCDIPNCNEANSDGENRFGTKRMIRPRIRDNTENFHDGPVYTISVNGTDSSLGPKYSYSGLAAAGWLHTEWSECIGWCVGGGTQTRGVRCADPSGCTPRKSPDTSRNCTPKITCDPHDGMWFTGEWSPCTSKCGGKQVRGVLCIGGSGRHLRDAACKGARPEHERDCEGDCSPSWYYSDWSQCTGNCSTNIGIQHRTVWCARGNTNTEASADSAPAVATDEAECKATRPLTQRVCTPRCQPNATIPPDIPIESQKTENKKVYIDVETTTRGRSLNEDCVDKLHNCALAVQARLCHYNYYVNNCCNSCKGR